MGPGETPVPSREVYALLGEAAARIHKAADSFTRPSLREVYDANCLIDRQLELMKRDLLLVGRWDQARKLGERLHTVIDRGKLERGICHMDLTLDNVHLDSGRITVFDFDSSGESWRALEPHAVIKESEDYCCAWLEAYRSVRAFRAEDERAIRAFSIMADFRAIAWKLGVAASSREPRLTSAEFAITVDSWLAWEL